MLNSVDCESKRFKTEEGPTEHVTHGTQDASIEHTEKESSNRQETIDTPVITSAVIKTFTGSHKDVSVVEKPISDYTSVVECQSDSAF